MAFIKICGMTDTRAVAAALEARVDAIGFVFAPSVRQVTPAQAAELARPARGRVLCVAVTQHPASEMLEEIFHVFRPDAWQTDHQDLQRHDVPNGMLVWPVLRGALSSQAAEGLKGRRILFEGPKSGTGKVADWSAARTLASQCELILAGGLSPANVGEAIAAVGPFGVDVSSGVEELPGRKSPALIDDFVVRARSAFARAGMGELT